MGRLIGFPPAIGSVCIALMGAYVKLWPPTQPTELGNWTTAFAVVGLLTFIAILYERKVGRAVQAERDAAEARRRTDEDKWHDRHFAIAMRQAVEGMRRRRVPRVLGAEVRVYLGDWELEALVPGGPPFGRKVGSAFEIRIAPGGRVLVNGDIYDHQGNLVASLYDSEFETTGAFASGHDANADADALEVVDESGLPVLQVMRHEYQRDALVIHAFWRLKDGMIIGAAPGQTMLDQMPPDAPRPALVRLFRYPSTDNPGRRA